MIFTESARISNLLQIQFFCIALVYIIQQIIEFLNIFLLLIGSHVREEVLRLNMVVAEFYKQIDQKSINGKLGIFVLADGMFKIQISFEAKSFGIPEWWLILIFAVVTGICGLLLAIRPGDGGRVLTVILGITLLAEGMLNFSTVITAVKIIKHQRPDVIEADFYEERKD